MADDAPTRYEQLAHDMSQAIREGLLKAGDRLPSVRDTCQRRGVSPSTVFQAYGLLEARGVIEARPRSGYYVRAQKRPLRATPLAAVPRPEATEVAVSALAFEILESTRDPKVVPLGSAFPAPHLFPLDELTRAGARAMRRIRPEQITTALTVGDEGLRQALRRRYALQGVPLAADELVITNGAMEALNLCLQAVTRPGDIVVVESPTFYASLQALERLGLRAVEVATDPREGVVLGDLQRLLDQHEVAACWFMPNLQNPLGSLMPTPAKRALVELLASKGVPLIEDDVYGELYADVRRPPPAKAFDQAGHVLHCASFSKCLAPGYRVGWAAAGRYAQQVLRLKMMTSLATSIPPQLAIADYLAQGSYDRHLRQLRAALSAEQQRARRLIERYFPAGTRVTLAAGGYFLWLELPGDIDALELHHRAMSVGISTAPGVLFSADRRFTHHLRLNVGHPGDARVDPAIRTLGQLASAMR
ncbi:DNA-binding transcriptional regulator, MocR family, contains an aminotransferase domain [Variovorax sp. HW608]|uniref:aminotransferase-like domain-containing protein n=1 Tax=Variovorax sp. HW608 TaxID=1034889 RepID=UPI00081FC3B3|nr:PLP-dependent aminotransferase family protein [Variovorax sp. HW608]SCK13598.1 DNA-binding transcriptional regulator, MocR family, contains an aminotransferase domain [Variovorax sp. HW608]